MADNCSSAAFCISGAHKQLGDLDLDAINLELWINGEKVQAGLSSAILGHPLDSLCELSRFRAKWGRSVEAGSVVLAGAATAAVAVKRGDKVQLKAGSLGELDFTVEG